MVFPQSFKQKSWSETDYTYDPSTKMLTLNFGFADNARNTTGGIKGDLVYFSPNQIADSSFKDGINFGWFGNLLGVVESSSTTSIVVRLLNNYYVDGSTYPLLDSNLGSVAYFINSRVRQFKIQKRINGYSVDSSGYQVLTLNDVSEITEGMLLNFYGTYDGSPQATNYTKLYTVKSVDTANKQITLNNALTEAELSYGNDIFGYILKEGDTGYDAYYDLLEKI